jgi:hypothetical protein
MSLARSVSPAALLALAFAANAAQAEPPAEATTCQVSQGSLAFIGCSLAQKLGAAARGASVTVVDLKTDRELPSPDALKERTRGAVSAALGPPSGDAKGEHGKLRVELGIEKSGGVLRVTADVRRALGLWQRIRHEKPRAEQHAFAEAPLDAELRALIPPPPLVVSEVVKLKAPERGIVALACGPLAEDGGQELALVSRSSVRVGRIAGHAFVERKKAAWSALSPVAPTPLREPIGSAEITPEGTLRVGLTDRKDGLTLSRDLAVTQRFEALMPVPGGGCAVRDERGFLAQLIPCLPDAARPRVPVVVDAVVGPQDGWVGRENAGYTLLGPRPDVYKAQLHTGAQLALGDADNDGNLELAYSADTFDAAKDRLTLVTLDGNKPARRFELPAAGISAIAICARREGPGMAPLVLATGDELWLIR